MKILLVQTTPEIKSYNHFVKQEIILLKRSGAFIYRIIYIRKWRVAIGEKTQDCTHNGQIKLMDVRRYLCFCINNSPYSIAHSG